MEDAFCVLDYVYYMKPDNYQLSCNTREARAPSYTLMLFPVITGDFSDFPVPFLKLHGSIDWRETSFDVPNIIPPTWSKHFDRYGKYRRIWNEAEKAIFYSDKILFIGCSMPSTDQHIHYLLQFGLANYICKLRNKDIYVVKPHWRCSDKNNYNYLAEEKEYNVNSIIPIEKTFKEFVNSDFLTLIQ